MDHLGASPLRPLLRLAEKALGQHRARLSENEAWRSFDEASFEALGKLGLFHARDLAYEYAEAIGPRAHWALLSSFFERLGHETADLAFVASLAAQSSALELWRRLSGEESDFNEANALLAFARGLGEGGVGRLHEGYLVGGASLVVNAPRATHFIARAEIRGAPALVAFARDEAVLTADLTGTLPGWWAGSAGELALHGAEVLSGDIKLIGAEVAPLTAEIGALESLLVASAALGVLKALGDDENFAQTRALISLEGVVELLRAAAYGETAADFARLRAVSEELLAEMPALLGGDSFLTAKLRRDLEAFPLVFSVGRAAATSKPASRAG